MSGAAHGMFSDLGSALRRDPALESFRRLFGHFLESFEILMASRLLQSTPSSQNPPRS